MLYHLCNISKTQKNNSLINSQVEFNKISKDNLSSCSAWLIDICLVWNNNKLSDLYGFDIAKHIRTVFNSTKPIIFYSALPLSYLEQISKEKSKLLLLYAPNSFYIEIPTTQKTIDKLIENVQLLSPATLTDIKLMLCDIKGIVADRLNHNLKFNANITKVIQEVLPYLTQEQIKKIDFETYQFKLVEKQNTGDENDFILIKDLLIKICNKYLNPNYNENNPNDSVPTLKYKILLLDDDSLFLHRITIELGKHFTIIPFANSIDAIKELKNDFNNDILCCICDWRLYKDTSNTYWQEQQGYSVLEYASKTGIRKLFALTSQNENIIDEIRNILNIKIHLLKKENVNTSEQLNIFTDILRDACKDIEEEIVSQPSSAHWRSKERKKKIFDFSLKDLYAVLRNTDIAFFDEIDERCSNIWSKYKSDGKLRYSLAELSTTHIDKNVLKEVLVQRRIWIALFLLDLDALGIYEKMNKNPKKETEANDHTQLKNKLCIKEQDIKSGKLLPDEKSWLIKNGLL